jgi:hypothetical protein
LENSAEKRESSDGDFAVNDRINKKTRTMPSDGDCDFSKKHQHPIPTSSVHHSTGDKRLARQKQVHVQGNTAAISQ